MRVTFGTGSIGAADPTTTLPNEQGQTIRPAVNPGQNIIIKDGRVFPQTLEASISAPIVWYNLTAKPQRIVFDNYKYNSVDSGTIPPGATFTWTPPAANPLLYTLEPSGFVAKVVVNPNSGGPGAIGGNSEEPERFTRRSRIATQRSSYGSLFAAPVTEFGGGSGGASGRTRASCAPRGFAEKRHQHFLMGVHCVHRTLTRVS